MASDLVADAGFMVSSDFVGGSLKAVVITGAGRRDRRLGSAEVEAAAPRLVPLLSPWIWDMVLYPLSTTVRVTDSSGLE